MSKDQLIKNAAACQRKANRTSLIGALQNGGPIVWLSCLIMGLGNIFAGQIIKGLLFLAIEAAFVAYMVIPSGGLHWLSLLPSLGDTPDQKVWNEEDMVYVTIQGDRSQLILLYAVATIVIIGAFIICWRASVRSEYSQAADVPAFWLPACFYYHSSVLYDADGIYQLFQGRRASAAV